MNNEQTIKALEELVKSEYTTSTALDAAFTDTEDAKLRKNYRKWRDSHIKQGEALNGRIKELGGNPSRHELRDGSIYRALWSVIRGGSDHRSLVGVRLVAERGIKHYVDHLDRIEDPRSLDLVRKNLEAKQHEMAWYDAQVVIEHNRERAAELEKTRERTKSLEKEIKEDKRASKEPGRGTPFTALAVAGAVGAAAFLISRRNDESDDDVFADTYSYNGSDSATHTE